jgi:hypothetical protein
MKLIPHGGRANYGLTKEKLIKFSIKICIKD